MTKSEVDAKIAKLTREYAEINKRLAYLRHRLSTHDGSLGRLRHTMGEASRGHGQPHALMAMCENVDWQSVCADANLLYDLAQKRGELEDMMQQEGISSLILPPGDTGQSE